MQKNGTFSDRYNRPDQLTPKSEKLFLNTMTEPSQKWLDLMCICFKSIYMTPLELDEWRIRMEFTRQEAADALGIHLRTFYALQMHESRNTGKPLKIDRRTALACAALEAGVYYDYIDSQ